MANPDKPPEIDEHFIGEWVTFGLTELDTYMTKAARFADFLRRRDETEEQDDPSSSKRA